MESIGEIVRRFLQPYIVSRNQGLETPSVKELLHEIIQEHPEAKSEISRGIAQALADTPVDSQRLEHIERMNKLDNVVWLQGIEAGVPEVDHSLATFNPRPDWPDVEQARDIINRWLRRGGPRLVTLSGPVGSGKSHLAIAAARSLLERGDPVVYREEFRMITELQNGVRTGTTDHTLGELIEVPWLILDDLGLTALSDWARGVMERLINSRWENAKVKWTLITTNLKGSDLPPRIASRLGDASLAEVVTINAPDYRKETRPWFPLEDNEEE